MRAVLTVVSMLVWLTVGTGCHVWSEIHGPSAGVGIEVSDTLEVSPVIEAGYAYQRHQPLASIGGGGYVNWSILDARIDLIANVVGHYVFLPPLPTGVSFVTSWSPALGWALGIDVSWTIFWFQPHPACYELSLSEGDSQACAYTDLGIGDVLEPAWLPSFNMRMSYRKSLEHEDHWLVQQPRVADAPPSVQATERGWYNSDPFFFSFRWQAIVAAGLLGGRSAEDYDNVRWFELRD